MAMEGSAGAASVDVSAIGRRARAAWKPLLIVGLLTWLDARIKGPVVLSVSVGLVVAGVVVFWPQIVHALKLEQVVERIPSRAKPLLAATPPLVWFAVRGGEVASGTWTVIAASVAVTAAPWLIGPALDPRLGGFYAARDRAIPRTLRVVLVLLVALLVAALVVYGSFAALPGAFFGSTDATPAGARTVRLLIGTLLVGVAGFLLLREPSSDA
jgi:hypothetical protein